MAKQVRNNMRKINLIHKQSIDEALHKMFGSVAWEVKCHLSQGASATIYQINCNGKNFIARISDPQRPNANISMEFHCMIQAENCGVAPHLYFHDAEKNMSIMKYINTKPLPFFNSGAEKNIKMLAETIAKLHGGKVFPQSYSIFAMLEHISQAVKKNFPNDSYVQSALNKIPILKSLLDVATDIKPSHRDLHGFNILYDGKRYFFIDWESAGNESFYFDLAVASNMLLFKISDGDSLLLSAYLKAEPNQEQLAKFKLMKVFVYLFYGFLLLYLSISTQEPRLTEYEIKGLKPFSQMIEQQIKENKPNIAGRFLHFGYSSLKEGRKAFETDAIQSAINLLKKVA